MGVKRPEGDVLKALNKIKPGQHEANVRQFRRMCGYLPSEIVWKILDKAKKADTVKRSLSRQASAS